MENLIYILFISVFVPILLMALLIEPKEKEVKVKLDSTQYVGVRCLESTLLCFLEMGKA
mgnify:CR=1 FL=1